MRVWEIVFVFPNQPRSTKSKVPTGTQPICPPQPHAQSQLQVEFVYGEVSYIHCCTCSGVILPIGYSHINLWLLMAPLLGCWFKSVLCDNVEAEIKTFNWRTNFVLSRLGSGWLKPHLLRFSGGVDLSLGCFRIVASTVSTARAPPSQVGFDSLHCMTNCGGLFLLCRDFPIGPD